MTVNNTAFAHSGEAIINGIYLPKLEGRVMLILYEAGRPITVSKIINKLGPKTKYATIYTILTRLEFKRAIIESGMVSVGLNYAIENGLDADRLGDIKRKMFYIKDDIRALLDTLNLK